MLREAYEQEAWEQEEDEVRDDPVAHFHYCYVCCDNWIHYNEECVGGGPALCPEHDEGE
jgi:hypothetical protein